MVRGRWQAGGENDAAIGGGLQDFSNDAETHFREDSLSGIAGVAISASPVVRAKLCCDAT
jgi:hypothetical protein